MKSNSTAIMIVTNTVQISTGKNIYYYPENSF